MLPVSRSSNKSSKLSLGKSSILNALDDIKELETTTPKRSRLNDELNDRNSSPSTQSSISNSSGDATASNYRNRGKKGDVVLKYNTGDDFIWECNGERISWPTKILSNEISAKLKFMFQKSRDMALAMDSHCANLGSIIVEEQNLETDHSLKASAAEDVVYIGRIRSDGKMTTESVYFEGVLESSEGHVVSLDLSQLQEYFLFPGQVLAVVGRNMLGKCVTASKILAPQPQQFTAVPSQASEDSKQLNVIIAAGPFTPSDSLEFEPITDLAAIIKESRPDVCIVMGPITDACHPLLQGSTFPTDETFETMFRRQVEVLHQIASSVSCQLILVSNHKDVHHRFTYPTPAYDLYTKENTKSNCLFLPDPAVISIGGLVFGLSSTDVLMHLSKVELARSSAGTDRMGRLAGHLLGQRSFYPLYPSDESLPLDVEHWCEFAQMPCRPHVLILPSELRYFIKDVDGTVVINPQHITKGQSGGFYCRLRVQLPIGFNGGSSVSEFIKADIVKI